MEKYSFIEVLEKEKFDISEDLRKQLEIYNDVLLNLIDLSSNSENITDEKILLAINKIDDSSFDVRKNFWKFDDSIKETFIDIFARLWIWDKIDKEYIIENIKRHNRMIEKIKD